MKRSDILEVIAALMVIAALVWVGMQFEQTRTTKAAHVHDTETISIVERKPF